MTVSRRAFFRQLGGVTTCLAVQRRAPGASLHCTPAPTFPVPLTEGSWRSAPFPVGHHAYNVSLNLDRPPGPLGCNLDPNGPSKKCPPHSLLDLDWRIWDGDTPIQSWPERPLRASAWSASSISCMLGGFEGRRNAMFTVEWNLHKDAGYLKDLRPTIEIVKNPGYWCWL